MNNFDGNLRIILEKKNNRTTINEIYYDGVSKVSPTISLDNEKIPCYFLIHLGGGYLEGEICDNYIELKDNCRSIITTQTPTIAYKCEDGISSKQFTTIKLGENSVVEYILDNTILFKNSMFEQYTDVYMKESSTFIYTDGITSGWSPDGEKFKYKFMRMRNRVFIDNKIVLLDNLILKPNVQEMHEIGLMECYTNYGTAIVIDRRINEEFIEELRKKVEKLNLDIKFAISIIEVNGLVIRVLGNFTQDIQKAIYLCINHIRQKLFGSNKLNLRKY
ncbi:urease accessory protein UreD [Clostridium perfringens]|uniref:urease accessory protein UreD n=1 Tax=Clostridium perfringens TaxID=1502 RepID=UPI0024BD2C32|nr:urease accessory protein UreD [Clostridium perfringens]ELC8463940.1 urease accessory protein UreD [Clostridium perfringens]